MELWRFLGEWHVKLVQVPLVLLLVGLLFDALGLVFKGERAARARWAGLIVSGMGTVGLLFAFICGIYAEIWAGRAGVSQHPIELHELMANIASWGFVILFACRLLLAEHRTEELPRRRKWLTTYVIAGFVWYGLLVATGYLGGRLVFEYGAGVAGAGTGNGLSLSDLNTLATRQTNENLRYSEWMHHVFGWMTLGLAVSLLAQAAAPAQGNRLKWIVPVFLLAGGIFLFFNADLDLYPRLTDLRQWRDREVQLHKTLAIIMAVIGSVGLWRLRKPGNAGSPQGGGIAEEGRGNSKLVAVLALIGGSLLFTHVHTVAPYANVAAGVYITHVVMGLVALSIGAARLGQDFWLRFRKPLALAFASLMLIEAVLLVSYNEGLPWFIGYGRYNRWGPGGEGDRLVTIAPFGNYRAAMYVDQQSGTVVVALRDRFTDDAAVMTLDEPPQLLLGRGGGGEEVAIPLVKSPAEAGGKTVVEGDPLTGSNFRGQADFLKKATFLSARLVMKVHGQRRVGYFDPWVTPLIVPVPPNELAAYQCPMHEGMRSATAGSCPLCGMPLMPIVAPRPAGELHDARYTMGFGSTSPAVSGGAPGARGQSRLPETSMEFFPQEQSQPGRPVKLAIVHEQPLHLIIVSEDLSYFDHVHPELQETGKLVLRYPFPRPGRYVMYADVTPAGDRAQVFRIPVSVNAAGALSRAEVDAANELAVDEASGKAVPVIAAPGTPSTGASWDAGRLPSGGGETVQAEMIAQPRALYAGLHAELHFRLTDAAGRPLTDLVPYLGAMGHCVALSEDTREYIHAHPEQIFTPAAGEHGGPAVTFGLIFPRAGRYRIWAQFKRAAAGLEPEKMVIACYTVQVNQPLVPAGVIRWLLNE